MARAEQHLEVGDESRGNGAVMTVPDDTEVIEAIIHASRAMVGIAIRSLTECGEAVTLPQYRTLVVLSDSGPRRLADLADALGVSPSTATRMCDRLVRKGLITRTRDELDRREVNLRGHRRRAVNGHERDQPPSVRRLCSARVDPSGDPSGAGRFAPAPLGRHRRHPRTPLDARLARVVRAETTSMPPRRSWPRRTP